jgi:hypothetical protein
MFSHGYYQDKSNGCIYYAEKVLTNTSSDKVEKVVEFYLRFNGNIDFNNGYVKNLEQFLEKFDKINLD